MATPEPSAPAPSAPAEQVDPAVAAGPPSPAPLLAVLDLAPAGTDDRGQDLFTGTNSPEPRGRLFGGQVLGQSVVAAQRTVDPRRPVHSMHGYFLRPGDPAEPVTFAVERLRDGGSFSARRVHAVQHGRPILSMIASFQQAQDGLDHAEPAPDVPGPEELPTLAEAVGGSDHPMARYWASARPVDVRHVDGAVYLPRTGAGPAPGASGGGTGGDRVQQPSGRSAVWMRVTGPLPDDDATHRAVLAWLSDVGVLEPVLRRHGLAWSTPGLKAASLDHALWWHRPARADEWLLFSQSTPSASGARGLGLARVHDRAGALVATVAQEGMLRVP